MKPKNIVFILAFAVGSLAALSGCKPKPIDGQAFIVTQAGLNLPLGDVEIDVINASDAEIFLHERKSDIDKKLAALKTKFDEAHSNAEIARSNFIESQQILDKYVRNRQFTNNPQYAALQRRFNALASTYNYDQGEGSRASMLPDPVTPKTLATMRADLARLESELEKPLRDDFRQKSDGSGQADLDCTALLSQLNALKTAQVFFADFAPQIISRSFTDSQGNFILPAPKQTEMLFAKAQLKTMDSTEIYFWLIDHPAIGEKLILSNNNLFAVPQ
jgi:hypothetical protein